MFSRPSLQALALSLLATGSLVHAGPCDLYASGGTPCIAAHGTTRALYNAYTGPLYQVSVPQIWLHLPNCFEIFQ